MLREYTAALWRLDRIPALEAGLLQGAWPAGEAPDDLHPAAWGLGEAFLARSREILRLSLHEGRIARQRERARKELEALQAARRAREAELALDSQQAPPPLRERVDGAQRRPGESLPSGEDARGQGPAWSEPHSPAQRPDPHPDPLPQGREKEQDQGLGEELALLSRKAA